MFISFVAEVSMVMVGALGRKGPGEGVFLSSAIMVALWGLREAEAVS